MKKKYISEETERELWWGERKSANFFQNRMRYD